MAPFGRVSTGSSSNTCHFKRTCPGPLERVRVRFLSLRSYGGRYATRSELAHRQFRSGQAGRGLSSVPRSSFEDTASSQGRSIGSGWRRMPDDWGGNGIGTDPLYPAPTERRLDESCPADVRAPAGFLCAAAGQTVEAASTKPLAKGVNHFA